MCNEEKVSVGGWQSPGKKEEVEKARGLGAPQPPNQLDFLQRHVQHHAKHRGKNAAISALITTNMQQKTTPELVHTISKKDVQDKQRTAVYSS